MNNEADLLLEETLRLLPKEQRINRLSAEARRLKLEGASAKEVRSKLAAIAERLEPPFPAANVALLVNTVFDPEPGEAHGLPKAPPPIEQEPPIDPELGLAADTSAGDGKLDDETVDPEENRLGSQPASGYISLYRKIRQHWLWPDGRRYTQLEAWEDILMSANYVGKTILLGSRLIRLERGQFLTSQVKLGQRWRWHRSTVSDFLGLLKADNMIDTETSNGFTLITIRNYSLYQRNPKTDPTAEPTPNRQPNRQPDQHGTGSGTDITNKVGSNSKKGKKLYRPTKSPFPSDFRISDELKEWARSNNLPSPESQFEKFRNHHVAKGSLFSNWDAALRNWLLKAKEFSMNGNGLGPSSKVTPTEGKYGKFR